MAFQDIQQPDLCLILDHLFLYAAMEETFVWYAFWVLQYAFGFNCHDAYEINSFCSLANISRLFCVVFMWLLGLWIMTTLSAAIACSSQL